MAFLKDNSIINGQSNTTTSGGTTALLFNSNILQNFNGSSNQDVTLPNATLCTSSRYFIIVNNSTGTLTIKDFAATILTTITAGNTLMIFLTDISSSAGVWNTLSSGGGGGGGGASAFIDFPSVAAGTLITGSISDPTYGTPTLNKAIWRRVGDSMEIIWTYNQNGTTGTAGSGNYLFNLPAGYSIDTTKAPVGSVVGSWFYDDGGYRGAGDAVVNNSTTFYFSALAANASNNTNAGYWSSSFAAFNTGLGIISVRITVPIAGWSGASSTSIDAKAVILGGSSSNADDPIIFDSISAPYGYDDNSVYNTGTGEFTSPVTGYCDIHLNIAVQPGFAGGTIYAAVNGTNVGYMICADVDTLTFSGSTTVKVSIGDIVTVRCDTTTTWYENTPPLCSCAVTFR